MVGRVYRGLRRAVGESVFLIDSTSLALSNRSAEWARFSAGVCGAKTHVIYDPDADQPIYAAITAANVNDITGSPGDAHRGGRPWVKPGHDDCGFCLHLRARGFAPLTDSCPNKPGQICRPHKCHPFHRTAEPLGHHHHSILFNYHVRTQGSQRRTSESIF